MSGLCSSLYFYNLVVVLRKINGIMVFRGCEVNIVDYEGNIDILEAVLKKFDFVIVSLYDVCILSGIVFDYIRVLIGVIKNFYIYCIGYLGNLLYEIDKEEVVFAVKEYKKVIEINNFLFYVCEKSKENCIEILKLCKKYGVYIVMGLDVYYKVDIGRCEII